MNRQSWLALAMVALVGLSGCTAISGGAGDDPATTTETQSPTPAEVTEDDGEPTESEDEDEPTETDSPEPTPTATAEPTATPGPAESTVLHYDGEELSLEAAPGQEVRGETGLPAGTELNLRLQSTDSSSPFLQTGTATVRENGTFVATLDMYGMPGDAPMEVIVVHDGTTVANASGHLAEPERPIEAIAESGTSVDHDGENVSLEAAPEQVIRGESDLEAGSELKVRIRSTTGEHPFLQTATANVTDDGTFEAAFNLTGLPNATAEVTVEHDGTTVAVATAVVTGGENVSQAAPNETREPAENETAENRTFDGKDTELLYDGENLTLEADAGQVVAGETNYSAGTELTVRIASQDDSNPFLRTATANVTEDGTFETTFNMTRVPSGTTFEVTVRHPDDDAVAMAPGRIE